MPRHRLMSDDFERIEIIAGRERRRRWSGEAKLRIVEETLTSGTASPRWRDAMASRPICFTVGVG